MECISNEAKTVKRHQQELSILITVLFIVGCSIAFILSSYLQLSPFDHFISYRGSDGPAGYLHSVTPPRLGVHTFGDYLLPRWQSQLDSPWFISDNSYGPLNNYLPFTMAFFWLLTFIPYWISLALFLGTIIPIFLFVVWKILDSLENLDRIQIIIGSIFMTAPAISLIDRGNVQFLLTTFCCAGLLFFIRGHKSFGAILIGLAIALKGYPAIFLIFWIRERRWRDCAWASCTVIVTTCLPLLFYQGGILRNLQRIYRNVRLNEVLYAHESLGYNNSLKGSLLSLRALNSGPIGSASQFFFEHINSLNVLLLVAVVFVMLRKSATFFDLCLLGAAMATTLVDFVGMYALSLYFIPVLFVRSGSSTYPPRVRRLLFFLIAFLLMPKNFPYHFLTTSLAGPIPTFASLLNGFTGVLIIVVCSMKIIITSKNRTVSN